ncbi:MAG: hypothetical protein KA165_07995 [Saprospiraceae bacterium]|nr:hypothetical protein [Saprospiraceae bacterium]
MESPHNPTPFHVPADISTVSDNPALDALAKEKHRRLMQRGQSWLGAGLLLMGLSFGINLLLFHSDGSFVTVMYVLTTLGTGFIVKGLVDILGF